MSNHIQIRLDQSFPKLFHSPGIAMNWEIVFQCVQNIAGMKRESPQAIVQLRQEIVASAQLSPAEKAELHGVLDGLQKANLYGQISLLSQLKDVLSRHAEFKVKYAEFGMRKE
ncbi:MAG: hypothetical protein ABI790_17085 [Betaproteobacteria bacterium]